MKRICMAFLLPLFCYAQAQTVDQIVAKTESTLRSLLTFKADFEHVFYSSSVSLPLREKGEIHFQKTDMMKWEYKDPEEKIFLSKDGRFQYYIPEDNQLYRGEIPKEGHEGELLYILSGKKSIRSGYVSELSPFPTEASHVWQLKLIPKEEGYYSHFLLEIDSRTAIITRILLFDLAGNKQELNFTNIKTNIRIPENTFVLKVPPGVEIIEY